MHINLERWCYRPICSLQGSSGDGEGNGNPLQRSCLENPRDGEAWWAAVCGVAQSRTQLKRLSSSSSGDGDIGCFFIFIFYFIFFSAFCSSFFFSAVFLNSNFYWGIVGSSGKESACNAGDLGSVPGLGRSPGGGHGNPIQYSGLEYPHGQRSLVGSSP